VPVAALSGIFGIGRLGGSSSLRNAMGTIPFIRALLLGMLGFLSIIAFFDLLGSQTRVGGWVLNFSTLPG
jgi:hypothetical protein